MAALRDVRDLLLLSFCEEYIDETEFFLLYNLNLSSNPDFPYWTYEPFELQSLNDAECMAEFRFFKNDIYRLSDTLQLPENIVCYNGTKVNKIEGLCIFLKRYSYPCRYGDMIPRFARSVPELCMICTYILNWIYDNFRHKLRDFNQAWLSPIKLEEYAAAIHDKGAAVDFCWGFVDGTVRPIC